MTWYWKEFTKPTEDTLVKQEKRKKIANNVYWKFWGNCSKEQQDTVDFACSNMSKIYFFQMQTDTCEDVKIF